MATKPPRNPLTDIPRSHFLNLGYTMNTAERPAAAAARVVLVATRPMPPKSMADRVLPGLKPYQPNHRITAPMAAMFKSCPGMGPPPSLLNLRPRRGPRAMAPARARKPPTVWTTVDPAKSRKTAPLVRLFRKWGVMLPSQPPGPQTQWPMIG